MLLHSWSRLGFHLSVVWAVVSSLRPPAALGWSPHLHHSHHPRSALVNTPITCCLMQYTRDESWFLTFILSLKNFLFYIGVEPTGNVVIVSGVQQSDSATHTHVSILPTSLPSRLPHDIATLHVLYSRALLVIRLNIAVCTCPPQTLTILFPHPSPWQP